MQPKLFEVSLRRLDTDSDLEAGPAAWGPSQRVMRYAADEGRDHDRRTTSELAYEAFPSFRY
ncbi:MAG: hypothetical protein LZF60_80191 [Nitrospira sp.]|nr:MAG: hypothetical protein LZF60_80191 [Nitrospira sp.]